jgi:hypothetical protein
MSNLVSPCCGANYTDNDDGRSYCCDSIISQGFCTECRDHAEPAEGFVCEDCEEFFEEPELDYEYAERMHDSYLEDRMDEARDMGE